MSEGGPYRSPPPAGPLPDERWAMVWSVLLLTGFFLTLPVAWPVMQVHGWVRRSQLERGKAVAERDPARVLPRLAHVVRATRWTEEWHTMASGLEEECFFELALNDGSVLWVACSPEVVGKYLERAGVKVREKRASRGGVAVPLVWMLWAAYVGVLCLLWRFLRA